MNRKELINLIAGTGLIVLFFMGFTEITDSLQPSQTLAKWQQFDLYADHAHVEPTLVVNHALGQPGSYFQLTGSDYPANSEATIFVNNRTVGTVQTNSAGAFIFELSTTQAEEGGYVVTVTVNPSATVSFKLDAEAPVKWTTTGTGTVHTVPAGIALTEFNYLPLIIK